MPFDPSTAKPDTTTFDPNTARPLTESNSSEGSSQTPDSPSILESVANSAPVGYINAAGGGMQQALSSMAGTAIGSPKLTQSLSPPGFVQDSMQQNPMTALAGNVAGSVMGAAPLIGGLGAAGTAVGLGEGLLNAAAANTVAGSILAGPDNRVLGGAVGLATTAISPLVSGTAKYLNNAFSITTKLKNTVGEIMAQVKGTPDQVAAKSQANMWTAAKAVEDKLFNNFRATSGAVETNPITHDAAAFLNNNADELLPAQQKVITNLIQNVSNSKNLADLHDARKIFAYDFGKFTEGRPLTADATNEFRSLTNTFSNVMQNNAENLGVGAAFKTANNYYQDTILPLVNTGAKETSDALANSAKDPMTAAKITDGLINRYINPEKPDVARAFLSTLDPVGRQAVEAQTISTALKKSITGIGDIDSLVFKKTIEDYQAKLGSVFSENTNKILNGLNRSIDAATNLGGLTLDLTKISTGYKISGVAATLGAIGYHAGAGVAGLAGIVGIGTLKLLQSQVGQGLLIKAGSEGGKEVGKQIVNGLVMESILSESHGASQ